MKERGQMAGLLPPGHPLAPRYWRDETSGVLAPAIERYLTRPRDLTVRDIGLIRAYIRQWIDSPMWDANPHADAAQRANLRELRSLAANVASVGDLRHWFDVALDMGHDPL